MTKIYDQHDKAFSQVSAYVLMNNKGQQGTISFKYPRDGAGRLYCYFHIHGLEMVRGFAGNKDAAVRDAVFKIKNNPKDDYRSGESIARDQAIIDGLKSIFTTDGGEDWNRKIEQGNLGLKVLRAI